jgi:hypothetical protein
MAIRKSRQVYGSGLSVVGSFGNLVSTSVRMRRRGRGPFRETAHRRLASRPATIGPVAQWLEQSTHNRLVGGSSPSGPTRVNPPHDADKADSGGFFGVLVFCGERGYRRAWVCTVVCPDNPPRAPLAPARSRRRVPLSTGVVDRGFATAITCHSTSFAIACICRSGASTFRPPFFPRARAASSPARVRQKCFYIRKAICKYGISSLHKEPPYVNSGCAQPPEYSEH